MRSVEPMEVLVFCLGCRGVRLYQHGELEERVISGH
jgi:hypothetical protein